MTRNARLFAKDHPGPSLLLPTM